MRKSLLVFLMVSAFFTCLSAQADTIIFKSGDRLTGKLVSLENGKLVFNANDVGQVTIDIALVDNFTTDEPVEFHFRDGTVLKSRALTGDPGIFAIEETKILPANRFPISDIQAINPPVKPAVVWTGNVTVGMTSTHGNTFIESANASANATRRSDKDRLNLDAAYLASRAEEEEDGEKEKVTTQESFVAGTKYDYFWTKKCYSFVNGRYKKDHIADLDYRIIGGLGMGYQWIESEKMKFSTDAGVAELCEKYISHDVITKHDEFSGQLGYNFDWKFHEKFTFLHNMRYYPSFGMFSDYFLTTDAEVRAAITKSMFTSFKAILDYDSTPAPDVGSTDTKYVLGVGWNF
jgi:putative salt-induced outer membrane protein YdiY